MRPGIRAPSADNSADGLFDPPIRICRPPRVCTNTGMPSTFSTWTCSLPSGRHDSASLVVSFNGGAYSDVAVSVKAQIASGGGTTSVGARWSGYAPYPTEGCIAEMDSSGAVRLWRVDTWSELGSYPLAGYQSGQWATLTLSAEGANLTLQVDGVTRIAATDSAFASGEAGLWSYAPTGVDGHRFDDFTVQSLHRF